MEHDPPSNDGSGEEPETAGPSPSNGLILQAIRIKGFFETEFGKPDFVW